MVLVIPTIVMILFWIGEFIIGKLPSDSMVVRWWRKNISDYDPDER